jgi:hypothetical protein
MSELPPTIIRVSSIDLKQVLILNMLVNILYFILTKAQKCYGIILDGLQYLIKTIKESVKE